MYNIKMAGLELYPASCCTCKNVWYQGKPHTTETAKCPKCGDRDHLIFKDMPLEIRRRRYSDA